MIRFKYSYLLFLGLGLSLLTCKNVSDVQPTNRTTFIKLFEKNADFAAATAEQVSDGYIFGGNLTSSTENTSFIIKTDIYGNPVWEKSIPSSSVSSIKIVSDGYLIFGDRIQTNDTALNNNDRTITQALITKMSSDGSIGNSAALSDPDEPLTDYHGTGLTLDNDGHIVTTGNIKGSASNSFYRSYVAVYDAGSLDTLWTHTFPLLDQDFVNAKNVFVNSTSGAILWSNSVQKVNLTQTLSYLSIPVVSPESKNLENFDPLGQNNPAGNRLVAQEIQPAGGGFGVVGTLADGQGGNGNMFFVKVGREGKFEPGSFLVLDGSGTQTIVGTGAAGVTTAPTSVTDDLGLALTSTTDGGFLLAGIINSTIERGNGDKDIWLVRLDISGAVLWDKVYGGQGEEIVSSVTALSDGTFLIAGSSKTNGLSSAYLMRVDANGEIKN